MADEDRKKSFLETLPGIITALAALIGSVAALVIALNGGDKEKPPSDRSPAQVSVIQAVPVNMPFGYDAAAQQAAEEAAAAKAEAEAAKKREAEWKQKLAEAEQRAAAENAARLAAAEEAAAAKARAEEAERRAATRKALEEQRLTEGKTIGQYIDHGNGTVTDTKTGLMWKRCSEGLSGVNCEEGKAEKYEYDDAVKRFKNIEYAGYSDWRMPTVEELKTLLYCSKGKDKSGDCNDGQERPTINQQVFPNTAWRYWSGSPNASYSGYAWSVDFDYGYSGSDDRNYYYAVRLVRGGQ